MPYCEANDAAGDGGGGLAAARGRPGGRLAAEAAAPPLAQQEHESAAAAPGAAAAAASAAAAWRSGGPGHGRGSRGFNTQTRPSRPRASRCICRRDPLRRAVSGEHTKAPATSRHQKASTAAFPPRRPSVMAAIAAFPPWWTGRNRQHGPEHQGLGSGQ